MFVAIRPLGVFALLIVIGSEISAGLPALAAGPKFTSPVVTKATPGHAVEIDVDIAGAKELFLVVSDGGNGHGCDWADWGEPRLVDAQGKERKLTELKWKSASAGFGQPHLDANVQGAKLRIAGKELEYGVGTHAPSVIAFDLPAGYARFRARGGLDNGGTDQNSCGDESSVQFLVFTEAPPALLAAGGSGGTQAASHEADRAVEQLLVADGLQATLFAAEPMLLSPTNLDIDARGRIWVCEVVNYRGNNGKRPEGDRILIFEDSDGDGKADKTTVYYQGRDVDSAMGICVLGNKVIVSATPNILVFTDDNGDDKPDRKEALFTKTGQPQHDHSAHSFLFGPDGKLYWNFGNTGQRVHDKDGQVVVDLAGNKVEDGGHPYYGGMPFRCNLDGSQFEVLGHNFRNNYEVTIDSFGTLWQSDNDDDGNRGVRINYVMEFGNYGYRDELTGAGWQSPRTNMESEVPLRHWHLNDPGVVPNLLQTGAGSPTGITVYEGRLLPQVFWDQVIHCDAGPSIVRAYPATKDGAGYKAEIVNILDGSPNRWFRPADVCVAPDGSLFITDWYDPGVGGHKMEDLSHGRIFRVAPPGVKYTVPKFDFNTAQGAIEALKNPNYAVRYLAWTALNEMGPQAEPALLSLYASDNPRHRARALWLLSKIPGQGEKYVQKALTDEDPDLRITALRAARELNLPLDKILERLVKDPSPQVRRECAIALRHSQSSAAPQLWAELAQQHDGQDRWYLEALGIAADEQWDAFLDAWLAAVGEKWNTPAGRDILWRSRATKTSEYLARIIADPSLSVAELPRYFRAFDFQSGPGKDAALAELAFSTSGDMARQTLILKEAVARLKGFTAGQDAQKLAALERLLDSLRGTAEFVSLVDRLNVTTRFPQLLELAQTRPDEQIGVEAVRVLLARGQTKLLGDALAASDATLAASTAQALGNSADGKIGDLLWPVVKDKSRPDEVRRQAARALARTKNGAAELLSLARSGQLDETVKFAAAAPLVAAPWPEVQSEAARLFPPPPAKNNEVLPPLADLLKRKGAVDRGKLVFVGDGSCAKCHVVNGAGKEVGPNLSEIGSKLTREAMIESILFPSAGISHNYETYALALDNGNVVTGILTSRTDDSVTVKTQEAILLTFKTSQIEEMKKLTISMMPADLQKTMTVQELIDVVEYLTTLKKAAE